LGLKIQNKKRNIRIINFSFLEIFEKLFGYPPNNGSTADTTGTGAISSEQEYSPRKFASSC